MDKPLKIQIVIYIVYFIVIFNLPPVTAKKQNPQSVEAGGFQSNTKGDKQ